MTQIQNKLQQMKLEIAAEFGLENYDSIDKGELSSRMNGKIGGEMTKRLIELGKMQLVQMTQRELVPIVVKREKVMKIGEVEKDSYLIVKVFSKMMKDGEEIRSPKSLDFPVKIQKVYPTGLAVDEIRTVVPAGDNGEESTFTVAFDSPNVLIDLYLLKDDMPPVVWEDITIKKVEKRFNILKDGNFMTSIFVSSNLLNGYKNRKTEKAKNNTGSQ